MGRFTRIANPLIAFCLLASGVLPGCRVEQDEYPEVAIPAALPPPAVAPGDSLALPNDAAHWRHFNSRTGSYEAPAPGRFEFTTDGVASYNDAPLFGSLLTTASSYDLANRSIRLIWRCNDAGASSDFAVALADSTNLLYEPGSNVARFKDLNRMETREAYGGSFLILNNVWYYTSISTNDTQFTISTAYRNFPENGGQVINRQSGSLQFRRGRIVLRSDEPGKAGCLLVINRLSIQ